MKHFALEESIAGVLTSPKYSIKAQATTRDCIERASAKAARWWFIIALSVAIVRLSNSIIGGKIPIVAR